MLFKVLNEDGTPYHGGNGKWSLPTKNEDGTWTPGDWMPVIEGELVVCRNGYHGCEDEQVLEWLGPALFEMECRGGRLDVDEKVVVREARLVRRFEAWDECAARLFACDCAEHVLPLFEQGRPDDDRAHHAIETARRYAQGSATEKELTAVRTAAWAAVRDSARAAERAAARAAAFSAWIVARDAARAAAFSAWIAARAAERAAARAAAFSAWIAAWAAVRDSARAAERRWQLARLMHYLGED